MPEATHLLPGLHAPVGIRIDPWGIAHIHAENRDDLFFAQGWNAARDRLWQIDIARKRGLGLLAGDFGPGYLEQDRAARLLLYRGDMAVEWAAYAPDAREICTAFTRGINAYVDSVLSGDLPLPPEFALLSHRPSHWNPEDVVRIRSHSLTHNATSELLRAQVMTTAGPVLGARLDGLRQKLSPSVIPNVPDELDLSILSERVLRDFLLGVSPASFTPERLAATLDQAHLWAQPTPLGDIDRIAAGEGSNNWAISGNRTASGRPILCLDPHRTHTLPSIRYIVHLTMPGLAVIGAGEPTMPGIAMGHNGNAAFGLTIFGHDQEDILCYRVHPDDPDLYWHRGAWQRMQSIKETLPVRGHPDQTAVLRFTCHGPVLHVADNHAFSLRTVWTLPGTAPYMASLSVMRAQSPVEYLDALKGWGCPSVNHVYADTKGHIVWKPSGAWPHRADAASGLVPGWGDGSNEWHGLHDPADNPVEIDPLCGFIATANAMNLPLDWNGGSPGFEWLDSSRHDFLNARLAENDRVTLADCAAFQTSCHSRTSWRLGAWLTRQDLPPHVATLLSGFDGDLSPENGAAAFLEILLSRHLGAAIARAEGAADDVLPLLAPYDPAALLDWLERHEAGFPGLDKVIEDAWQDCVDLMGKDPAGWSWGAIHKLTLRHPLHRLAPADWSMPPVPLGGSAASPNYAGYRASDLGVIMGPSVRMMIDVGDWDQSLFINTPGQSGFPASPHYADLQQDWARGRYQPLLYSQAAIAELNCMILHMLPAADSDTSPDAVVSRQDASSGLL